MKRKWVQVSTTISPDSKKFLDNLKENGIKINFFINSLIQKEKEKLDKAKEEK